MEKFMEAALQEAYEGIEKNHGGPFGAVVVKNGKIVGRGHNRVLYKKDPTCHGEMEAIRDACKNLETHDLTGCQLYTTAEPCPMCLEVFCGPIFRKYISDVTALIQTVLGSGTMFFMNTWMEKMIFYPSGRLIMKNVFRCLSIMKQKRHRDTRKYKYNKTPSVWFGRGGFIYEWWNKDFFL